MVNYAQMDSKALIAAALAPSSDSANIGVQADLTANDTMVTGGQDPAQTVSPDSAV